MTFRPTFGRICEIDPDDASTWEDRNFLTFDIDWAPDAVLADTIDLVEHAGVAATWFVTHDTPLLGRLRDNPLFELGIHPNFNFLLAGQQRNGANAGEVLDGFLAFVPEAKSVRSHSMTQSSGLLDLFARAGLTHEANHFIPEEAGIELKPWRNWTGLVKVPYFWEDDVSCLRDHCSGMAELTRRPGLRVFDFHPIHVFLNTEHLDRYERARPVMSDMDALLALRASGCVGARDLLGDLVERR